MKVYPKRTDHLYAIQFRDTNVTEICEALRQPVTVVGCPTTGHLDHIEVEGGVINPGDWVLLNDSREVVKVLHDWAFREQYSKDGL